MSSPLQHNGIIYCRVSSKDQVDGTSLETQERHCRDWAERHQVSVLRAFIDKGESAKTIDRTEFLKAIAFCSQKKNGVTDFIVYKIDRFARSQDDHVSVRATLRRHGVELRSATEPINSTPVGRAMEGMISVFAEFDNNVRRERCVGGMLERLRQGVWVWRAPLGYMRPAKGAHLLPDPVLAPYIRLAFTTYANGAHTYESLGRFLSERGMRTTVGKAPCAQLMHKILTNPLYCGIIEAWGERHEGKFEPLVPRALFDQCQPGRKTLSSDKQPARSRYNPAFPLRRTVCTQCGARLTGSFSRGSGGKRYPYYHHQKQNCAGARFLPKASFEATFIEYLQDIALDPRFEKLFAVIVRESWERELNASEVERSRIEREIDSLTRGRQQIFDLHRTGKYTDDEFLEQKILVTERLGELQRRLAASPALDFPVDEALRECLPIVRNPAAMWARLDLENRIEFQNVVFVGGEIRFDGESFWNSQLSRIYRLNQAYVAQKSTFVDLRGKFWNPILADLKGWAEFCRRIKGHSGPNDQLRLAA
jgi:site-specific DNA recombinase